MKRLVSLLLVVVCMASFSLSCAESASVREKLQEQALQRISSFYADFSTRHLMFLYDEYDDEKQLYRMYYSVEVVPYHKDGWITWYYKFIEAKAHPDSGNTWSLSIAEKETICYPNEGIIGTTMTGADGTFTATVLDIDTTASTMRLRIDAEYKDDSGLHLSCHETGNYSCTAHKAKSSNPFVTSSDEILIDLGEYNGLRHELRLTMTGIPISGDLLFEALLTGYADDQAAYGLVLDWNIDYDTLCAWSENQAPAPLQTQEPDIEPTPEPEPEPEKQSKYELGCDVLYDDMNTVLDVVNAAVGSFEPCELENIVSYNVETVSTISYWRNAVMKGEYDMHYFLNDLVGYVFENETVFHGSSVVLFEELKPFEQYVVLAVFRTMLTYTPGYHLSSRTNDYSFEILCEVLDDRLDWLYRYLIEHTAE